ncbi:DUF998 domain-containing protein [Microbacterium sp. Yaish 1]|uniref:DUF998 domain-containing protein n=1 Tax=Microbacterium sp. Yaish 1 TaxID=2025014 RepID=UPI000B93C4AF|nr:DUF998 domain-containing protein [Microbacterium sp. Yaish 1]OYC97897.1 hypothetical protein CI089_05065 [Microbacterium sp. Yaish 1]
MTGTNRSMGPWASTGLLWMLGPLWYLLCEAIAATAFPGYSYATNYISDLGVPDKGILDGRVLNSPLHAVMNAGFIGEGILFLLGLVLLLPRLHRTASVTLLIIFGALHTVGIVLVGVVPGAEAYVHNGLIVWHVVGAFLAIASGNLVAIIAGRSLRMSRVIRRTGSILGALGFASAALLMVHFLLPDGIWERASVYTFLAWQLVTATVLLRGSAVPDGPR